MNWEEIQEATRIVNRLRNNKQHVLTDEEDDALRILWAFATQQAQQRKKAKKATMIDFHVEDDPYFNAWFVKGKDKRFHCSATFAEYPGLKFETSMLVSNEMFDDIGRKGVEEMLRSQAQQAADERLNGDAA